MRVLILNQAYHPDVVATAQHAHDLARHLVREGHEVHVVTSRSLYNGRGATLPPREVVDGVNVRRVGLSLFGKSTMTLRSVDSGLFLARATFEALRVPRPDVVLALCNPPFVALVARALEVLRGVPWVYWLMDLYPDLPVACGAMRADSAATRAFDALNASLIRHATRAVSLGRCMTERVAAKGVDRARLALVPPWADSEEIVPLERGVSPYRAEWSLGDDFVVMYSGNFGLGHDLDSPCRAASSLAEARDVSFVFAGGGKRQGEVAAFAAAHPEARIQVHPHQPRERLCESLGAADVHLVSLEERALGVMVPSKLFGIMAAGRAAIVVAPASSEIARIVVENGCGLVVPPGQPERLAEAIRSLAADRTLGIEMGRRGREALVRVYDRPLACDRLVTLLQEAADVALRDAPLPATGPDPSTRSK
jgi:colanic acid biosynthesis glycosyl transferase WcaI